ncbi:MAG TPA: hypothetical protein PLS53_14480 [Thermoanaerobaculaceae bacterium]|nr:hypothetical protein [Thermoanaerobaculaceae bacterium]HPS79362.1 hypothetical protein [Thermoanaerobaculaceae bacterium]
MKPAWRLAACALPGLVVAAAAAIGDLVPTLRDLPAYFVPLRHHTAQVLRGQASPAWNPFVGCGEPFFANPQSDLLYPPAWLALVFPAPRAVGVEVGLHLALLGLGSGLLARRLGVRPGVEVAAGWGVCLAGPMMDAAGVLNNLETLAWTPWLWWAALGARAWPVAVFAALAWLGAEPWLALMAMAGALVLSPRRRTVGALTLAVGLVAVQALPFAAWARTGDRGRGISPNDAARGAIRINEVAAMVVPGLPLPPRGDRFVAHLTMPFWVLLLGGVAAARAAGAARRLAFLGWAAAGLAILTGLPWLRDGWAVLSRGLVWFPGRLLFLAVVALVPAAATRVGEEWHLWKPAMVIAALALTGGLLAGGDPLELTVQAACAAAALGGPVPVVAAVLGSASLGPAHLLALEMTRLALPPLDPCVATPGRARVVAVAPSTEQLVWVEQDPVPRQRALGWGYWPLLDGRSMARTFAPARSRALASHLAAVDRGAAGRWWLDALAAPWIVSQRNIPGLLRHCQTAAGTLLRNPTAWPEAWVVTGLPAPGERPIVCGTVSTEVAGGDTARWRCRVDASRGVLLLSRNPDPGWRFELDGRAVPTTAGPGILHGVPVPVGEHVVEAHYRPPGLLVGLGATLLSLLGLTGGIWRRW